MKKVVLIGTCGSGKTTVGHQLAQKLGISCTDMDELYWLPSWQKRPFEEFQNLVDQATAADRWIVCGNYSKLQYLTVGRADTVVWLDLPLCVLLWRIIKRSILQRVNKTAMCNGNHQSLGQFWWLFKHLFKSYWQKKKRYKNLRKSLPEIAWVQLKTGAQVKQWLSNQVENLYKHNQNTS